MIRRALLLSLAGVLIASVAWAMVNSWNGQVGNVTYTCTDAQACLPTPTVTACPDCSAFPQLCTLAQPCATRTATPTPTPTSTP